MAIQWFPGHMTSARKKVAETLAMVDVVVEVVDARLPAASTNPMVHELRAQRSRPCLKVLNKADLADAEATTAWLAHFQAQAGVKAAALSCRKAGEPGKVIALAQKLAPHRNDTTKPLRLMVMGVPNVGKSTLMNALLKRKAAAVGDEPAITKQVQRYDVDTRLVLFDTPGLMWPKIAHPDDGLMLAASHAIGVNAYIDLEVAIFLADLLLARYPEFLAARYAGQTDTLDAVGILERVAERRGCRVGGKLDLDKASLILLNDFRSGALGRISLETPESRATRLMNVDRGLHEISDSQ